MILKIFTHLPEGGTKQHPQQQNVLFKGSLGNGLEKGRTGGVWEGVRELLVSVCVCGFFLLVQEPRVKPSTMTTPRHKTNTCRKRILGN